MSEYNKWKNRQNNNNHSGMSSHSNYRHSTHSNDRGMRFLQMHPKREEIQKPKNNSINMDKKLNPKQMESRINEGLKRLERCRFIWQRLEGLKLIESVIRQENLEEQNYHKIKYILSKFSEDISDVISSKSKALISELERKSKKSETKEKEENKLDKSKSQ
ncbi:MAG: hypothetical protein QXW80_03710 [Candidatus Micrarchaeia archaeon]